MISLNGRISSHVPDPWLVGVMDFICRPSCQQIHGCRYRTLLFLRKKRRQAQEPSQDSDGGPEIVAADAENTSQDSVGPMYAYDSDPDRFRQGEQVCFANA